MSTLSFVILTGGAVILAWVAWEVYALRTGRKTITAVVRSWGAAGAALIALVMGLLVGHFWL